MHRANPDIKIPEEVGSELNDQKLQMISRFFEQNIQLLEKRIDDLRQQLEGLSTEHPEREELAIRISKLHSSYNRQINLIAQSQQILDTYYHHFLRESRWRVIDVLSHHHGGKIYYFGAPVQGFWIWVITTDGEFILGNRKETLTGGFGQRLPHSTIAKGKQIYAAGEVEFVDGAVRRFNSQTGHYFSRIDPQAFNKQCKDVFLHFAKNYHIAGPKRFILGPLS